MPEHADTTNRIALNGDWSIIGINCRLHELSTYLKTLRANRERTADSLNLKMKICVDGVETIDASGCQLLAVFLRHVR
jgi:anti-anti-sigma regulatory factor